MTKKKNRKQLHIKQNTANKSDFSEKRQQHYAFGFLVGEY
jgi:hypothetical protein